MPFSVSPYELLRSSIPRPAPTTVTPYDLYSAVLTRQEPAAPPEPLPQPAVHQPEQPLPPVRRTHYIADIRARHEQASGRSGRPAPPAR